MYQEGDRLVRVKANYFLFMIVAAAPAWGVEWSAQWITVPNTPRTDYGIYHFRKAISLAEKPAKFVVHASGDNRYQLFVNGKRVAWGPARGDLYHWRYETVDLAPELRAGKNVIAAVVWNHGADSPMAQVTNQTGFLLQGDTPAERAADTSRSWKCRDGPGVLTDCGAHGARCQRLLRGRAGRAR